MSQEESPYERAVRLHREAGIDTPLPSPEELEKLMRESVMQVEILVLRERHLRKHLHGVAAQTAMAMATTLKNDESEEGERFQFQPAPQTWNTFRDLYKQFLFDTEDCALCRMDLVWELSALAGSLASVLQDTDETHRDALELIGPTIAHLSEHEREQKGL